MFRFGKPPFEELSIEDYQTQYANGNNVDHLLLDVREIVEFTEGRIPGSVNLPMSQLAQRIDEIPRDKPVILVCRTGARSAQVAAYLKQFGFEKVYNLLEGTMGWISRDLPLER